MEVNLYKLREICNFVTGIDPNNNEKKGETPFIKLGDTLNYEINYEKSEKINSKRKKTTSIGDLILCWSCSIGKSFIIKQKCFFSTAFYKLENKHNLYLNKYLHFYFIKNENNISKLGVGSVLKKANMKILGNIEIKLPNLKIQQEIINIIEPKEKLFLKYHSIIDISNVDKFKKSWFHLINIIEPFEKLISNFLMKKNMFKKIIYKQINYYGIDGNYKISNFKNFQGFPFKTTDFYSNGKYKVFKIANILNKSDNNVEYTNNYIEKVQLKVGDVVTGLSGTIGTSSIIFNEDWLLNQRLLSINTKYSLVIKYIIEKNKINLHNKSTGSVQMNITKDDILNLSYNEKLNNDLNLLLSKLHIIYLKIMNLINEIIKKLIDIYVI